MSTLDQFDDPQPFQTGSAEATASLDEVDIGQELSARPRRPPDLKAEQDALVALATEMARTPRNMLQKLVETAASLCGADSAGISLLEGEVFRWEAVAGAMAQLRNSTLPRNASPCGVCVGRDSTQLMSLPDRFFTAIPKELKVVEVLLVPFHNHGKPVGTIWIVAHDSTKKFDREDERRVRMLAQFASAGWQLWKAYETEAEGSKLKDEFIAMLGHELRNPLAVIVSANEILKRSQVGNRDVETAIGLIDRQSQHLRRLIDDLVDLSRITRGKVELQKEIIELQTIVHRAIEATKALVDGRRHQLSISTPDRPILIFGDPVRLVQLLSNLIDNAAKYTPIGGKIYVAVDAAADEATIRITDTGIGIPLERREKIFEFFTQFSDPSSAIGGLGVGLALVRILAKLHGGVVEVASELGRGSQFTVRLPLTIGPEKSITRAANEIEVLSVGRRILLVEDNSDAAEALAILLTCDGHTVHIANNGIAAMDIFFTFRPEIVLLDLGLPGMSGYDLARELRKQPAAESLLILAVSGNGREEDRRRSIEAGCDDHIVKPVQLEVLQKSIETGIRKIQSH